MAATLVRDVRLPKAREEWYTCAMKNTVSVAPRSVGEAELLPLPGAVTNAKWRARGAFEDAFYIRATNWWARMPDGRWMDRLRILSSGGFRARGVGGGAWTNYPPPFTQKLSLAPEANWHLLEDATGGTPFVPVNGQDARSPSLFWHATTPSNTLVVSWIGGLYARSHTNLVDFQAEIFNDGSLDYRYADRTEHFAASLPFDLDGDGLENSVDPDPLTAGPDAHGTNAEWYNTVCSNVLEAVASGSTGTTGILPVDGDSVLSWRADVNSNAYYFVDVVAERGPAPIYFTGDRDSRLGNPVVVALAGVTNRVPLLIGVDYAVTSDTPFTVSFPIDYIHPTVTTNGVADYNVRWPLNFVFTESLTESNRVYTVTVEPYDPGGVLTWEGGGMRSGASSGCGCGCLSCVGFSIGFNCSAICTCHGECHAVGGYAFENALFAVTGGVCRCGFDDPQPYGPSPHDPSDPPSIFISFSKPAVIFEDAYEDKPGVTVPRRSTRVGLTIDIYGGPHGGAFLLSDQNLSKLTKISGNVLLPYGLQLAAYESFHATGVFEGVVPSDSENDVKVIGSFLEADTDAVFGNSSQLSVVRVELRPRVVAPKNFSPQRHSYGVCELVRHLQTPSTPVVTWNPTGGGSNEMFAGSQHYRCPLDGCENPLRAEIGTVHYTPLIDVQEPFGVESTAERPIVYSNAVHKGEAGGIGMKLYLYITPLEVSFSEIAVEEVPCLTYEAEGYFTNIYFNGAFAHTGGQWGAGAGRWADVDRNNQFGEYDEAAYNDKIPWLTPNGTPTTNAAYAWTEGYVYIDNPFGWHVKGTSGNTPPYKVFGENIQDTIMLDEHGRVGVWKLNNWVIRTTNDVVSLFGPKEHRE